MSEQEKSWQREEMISTLKVMKQSMPINHLVEMSSYMKYKNKVDFQEMLHNYPKLPLYERLHLDVSGIVPHNNS